MPPTAPEFQPVRPGLSFWQAYDPSVKTELCCCSLETPEGLVFIDPVLLAPEALEELLAGKQPAGIVLTNANHERSAAALGKRLGIEIWSRAKVPSASSATRRFEDGDLLFGALEVDALEGFADGETALHSNGVLILGDALIHAQPYGFAILPDKYCADPKAARASLRKLLRFSPEILTFAHGLPIVSQAAKRLAGLINS